MARRNDHRDPKTVKSIAMRMTIPFIEELDELCYVNHRSRRQIMEMLIHEAYEEFRINPAARITPLEPIQPTT